MRDRFSLLVRQRSGAELTHETVDVKPATLRLGALLEAYFAQAVELALIELLHGGKAPAAPHAGHLTVWRGLFLSAV